MDTISVSERKRLKSIAHHLRPVIQIGRNGVTDAVIKAIDKALLDHELIKIKYMDFKEERRELTSGIAEKTGSIIIAGIGNIAILYRKNEEKDQLESVF